MKLKKYREQYNLSIITIAKTLRVSRQHIYDIEAGKTFPSRTLAKLIERKTSGQVTARELLGL